MEGGGAYGEVVTLAQYLHPDVNLLKKDDYYFFYYE